MLKMLFIHVLSEIIFAVFIYDACLCTILASRYMISLFTSKKIIFYTLIFQGHHSRILVTSYLLLLSLEVTSAAFNLFIEHNSQFRSIYHFTLSASVLETMNNTVQNSCERFDPQTVDI